MFVAARDVRCCVVCGRGNACRSTLVSLCPCAGAWYYEVEVVSGGLAQIGWADGLFVSSAEAEDGVSSMRGPRNYCLVSFGPVTCHLSSWRPFA